METIYNDPAGQPDASQEAFEIWKYKSGQDTHPDDPKCMRSWDAPVLEKTYDFLLEGSPNSVARSRYLGTVGSESGAWLEGLTISSMVQDWTMIQLELQ